MTDDRLANQQFTEGFLGTSPSELAKLSDAELADWQSHIPAGLPQYILAEREWERRMISHQLKEQYDLDARIAKAAEVHAERIAESNRWWGFAGAVLGVIGTLSGVGLGQWLGSSDHGTTATPQAQSPLKTETTASGNSATSAASSTISPPEKKAK